MRFDSNCPQTGHFAALHTSTMAYILYCTLLIITRAPPCLLCFSFFVKPCPCRHTRYRTKFLLSSNASIHSQLHMLACVFLCHVRSRFEENAALNLTESAPHCQQFPRTHLVTRSVGSSRVRPAVPHTHCSRLKRPIDFFPCLPKNVRSKCAAQCPHSTVQKSNPIQLFTQLLVESSRHLLSFY